VRARLPSVLVVAALMALTACDGNGNGGDRTLDVGGEKVPVSRLEEAASGLCTARDQARGDVAQAGTTFYDRSHDALHTIARALERVDRTQAGSLLEAKQRVEADLMNAGTPPATVAADLDRLAGVTRAALAAVSVDVPACP
jgi:hypothetical protein